PITALAFHAETTRAPLRRTLHGRGRAPPELGARFLEDDGRDHDLALVRRREPAHHVQPEARDVERVLLLERRALRAGRLARGAGHAALGAGLIAAARARLAGQRHLPALARLERALGALRVTARAFVVA